MLLMRGKTRAWQDALRSAPHQLQIASESQITIAPFLTLTGIIATFALHIGRTLYSFFLSPSLCSFASPRADLSWLSFAWPLLVATFVSSFSFFFFFAFSLFQVHQFGFLFRINTQRAPVPQPPKQRFNTARTDGGTVRARIMRRLNLRITWPNFLSRPPRRATPGARAMYGENVRG